MTIDNTPYALGLETDQDKAQIIGLDGSHIAYVECSPAIDIAKGIIRAVNSHAALLNACEMAIGEGDEHKAMKAIIAAIAQARGDL